MVVKVGWMRVCGVGEGVWVGEGVRGWARCHMVVRVGWMRVWVQGTTMASCHHWDSLMATQAHYMAYIPCRN